MRVRTKTAALLVSLPVAGLVVLSGAGAASAASCPSGFDPVVFNGVTVCSPSGTGGVAGGGSVSLGNGASTVPGAAAPIVGGSGNAPVLPPLPAPIPVYPPAPVHVEVPAVPVPAVPIPVPAQNNVPAEQAPVTNSIPAAGTSEQAPNSNSAVENAGVPAPAESQSAATPSHDAATASPTASSKATSTPSASASATPSMSASAVPSNLKSERVLNASSAAPIFVPVIAGLMLLAVSLIFKFKSEWFGHKRG